MLEQNEIQIIEGYLYLVLNVLSLEIHLKQSRNDSRNVVAPLS